MTDNRTTELCKLLEERGEDYTRNDSSITWGYYNDPHTATESMDGTLIVTGLTPEQAIAATLGSDASAVRLAERLRGIADEMRNMGASAMTPHELLACYAREVDKVADSLMFAATLGSERDEIYNAGFDNGVKACLQILDGYLDYPHSAVENISKWVDEQWKEYES